MVDALETTYKSIGRASISHGKGARDATAVALRFVTPLRLKSGQKKIETAMMYCRIAPPWDNSSYSITRGSLKNALFYILSCVENASAPSTITK